MTYYLSPYASGGCQRTVCYMRKYVDCEISGTIFNYVHILHLILVVIQSVHCYEKLVVEWVNGIQDLYLCPPCWAQRGHGFF